MHLLLYLFLLGTALVLQTTVLDQVALRGVKPDLVLLLAALSGFLLGPREGAFLGFVGGAMMDLFAGSYIGLNALAVMTAGYLAGEAGERLYRESALVATGVTFFAAAGGLAVNYLLLLYLDIHVHPLYALVRVILPTALYTAVLAPFFFGRAMRYIQIKGREL